MAESRSVELYKIGIAFAVGGIILMMLTLLDHLQDGKTDGGIVAVEILLVITGALMYVSGRKSKAQDK